MRYMVVTYAINGRKIDHSEHETPGEAGKCAAKELEETGWCVEVRIFDLERVKYQ